MRKLYTSAIALSELDVHDLVASQARRPVMSTPQINMLAAHLKHCIAKVFGLLLAQPLYRLQRHAHGLLLDHGFCILKACSIVYRYW